MGETSNVKSHLMDDKMLSNGHGGVQWPNFLILGLQPKFGMIKDRNFKFGKRIDLNKSHLMDDKISPKG